MSKTTIAEKSQIIRNENQPEGNSRARIADVLDDINESKADLEGGKVPAHQLPSYVDDVIEFQNLAAFPEAGESGKIYLALDTNYSYRWSGSQYTLINIEKDTLESVVNRGNYVGDARWITFSKSSSSGVPSRTFAFGANPTTFSLFFGNMNPTHTGLYNISQGYNALPKITSGEYNTTVGHYAGSEILVGSRNVLLGYFTGNKLNTGSHNVVVGVGSMQTATSASVNVAIGDYTLGSLVTGVGNIAIGKSAGSQVTGGNNNVFIGNYSGLSNNIDNILAIHSWKISNTGPTDNISSIAPVTTEQAHVANSLIYGKFDERWIKINGTFSSTGQTSAPVIKTNPGNNFPAAPEAGQIFFKTPENKHFGFDGTTWNALY